MSNEKHWQELVQWNRAAMTKGEKHEPKHRTLPEALKPNIWKPGQSGNPKGRPRKEICLTSLVKAKLEEVCPKDPQKRTWGEVLILSWLQNFMKGHPTAMTQMLDRVDGKLKESIDVSGGLDVTSLTPKERAARIAALLKQARKRRDEQDSGG